MRVISSQFTVHSSPWLKVFLAILVFSIFYLLLSGAPALAQVSSCDAGQTACPQGCTLGVNCSSCWSAPTCTITGQTFSTCGSCQCPSGQVVCGSACQAPAGTQGQTCDSGGGAGSGTINQCGTCVANSPRAVTRQYTSPGAAEDGHINILGNIVTTGNITLGGVARTSWPAGSQWTTGGGGTVYYSGGNVGIGATVPAERLEVRDDTAGVARLRIADTGQNPEFQLKFNTGGNDHWAFYVDRGDTNKLKLWGAGDTGNNRITIDTAGRVGIGTTMPGVALDVAGDVRASGGVVGDQFCFSDGACLLVEDGWPTSQWITSGANIYYGLGNVGVGTTTPLNRLHVVTSAVGDGIRLSGADNPRLRVIDTTNNAEAYVQAVDDAGQIGTLTNHPLRLVTNNATRATLDTSGNLSLTGNLALSAAGATVDGVNLDNVISTPPGCGNDEQFLGRVGGSWTCIGAGDVGGGAENDPFFTSWSNAPVLPSLGIGIPIPAELLEISRFNPDDRTARIRITDVLENPELQLQYRTPGANDHWGIYVDQGDALKFKIWGAGDAGANRLTIDTGGNVGVGTTAPTARLHVSGSSGDQLRLDGNGVTAALSRSTTSYRNRLIFSTGVNNDWQIGEFYQNGNFAIRRITGQPDVGQDEIFIEGATGNVGIGTATPAAKLDVAGDVRWSGSLTNGTVPWVRLGNFPGACPPGQFVTAVAGTLTCAAPAAAGLTGSGTINRLAKFTAASTLGDSILTETNGTISVGGSISATGCFGPVFQQGSGSAVNGNRGGYGATVCPASMHMCTSDEILNSVQCGASVPASGSFWVLEGPPGYTAAANDCRGLTSAAPGDLGTYWDFSQGNGGVGWMTPCSSTLQFACCS